MDDIKTIIKKCMRKDKYINFTTTVLLVLFTSIILVGLVLKPVYDYNDIPIFGNNNFIDVLSLLFFVLFYYFLFKINIKDTKKNIIIQNIVVVGFILVAIFYIYMIPLDVFSDMKMVYRGSTCICDWNLDQIRHDQYFNTNPNNLAICFFYGILMKFTVKSIFVLKLLNIILVCLINYFIIKIITIFDQKATVFTAIVYSYMFIPALLYVNHIYTDIPFVFLTVLSIYLYLTKMNVFCFCILSLAYMIRPIAIIFLVAIVIDYFIKYKNISKLLRWLSFFFIILILYNLFINKFMLGEDKALPIWSYVYMGFNKTKFGFQDGSHLATRNFTDVVTRITEYSFLDFFKLINKKIFWTWNEGTYQVGRYAFGPDVVNIKDKFLYETAITKYFMVSTQLVRKILTVLIRGQYVALFIGVLMHWGFNKQVKYNVFNLCFLGSFLFYCVWEIKSRYVFHLYPYMIIMAYMGYRSISIRLKIKKRR